MQHSNTTRNAWLSMLLGAALIGSNGLMVQLAGTPPTVSAFWRMLLAALLLFGYVIVTGAWKTLPSRVWIWIWVPAGAFAADLWLWHRSILLIGPGLATLLANAQVFFMALAGVLFYRERLDSRFVGGLLLAFVGLWLLLGGHWNELPSQYRWGVWLGLATGICYAGYNLGLKRAQREAVLTQANATAPIEQVLAMASLGCAVLLGLAGWAEGASFAIPSWRSFCILLLMAAVGHCLSWVLISRAMQSLTVGLIGLLLLLQPMVAFFLDIAILNRVTTSREWLGVAITLLGIFLASIQGRRRTVGISTQKP